jgi:hypothetical protein
MMIIGLLLFVICVMGIKICDLRIIIREFNSSSKNQIIRLKKNSDTIEDLEKEVKMWKECFEGTQKLLMVSEKQVNELLMEKHMQDCNCELITEK